VSLLSLPDSLRSDLKEPLGPIATDAATVLGDVSGPVVTVGDIVTYHVIEAGHVPRLALVDERTKREAVDAAVFDAITGFDERTHVDNPPATLTADLLGAIADGLDGDRTTLVVVDGEEDLAALPAVVAAPDGATVLYGQPDEGMVVVAVDAETRAVARDLLERMDGDGERVLSLLR